MSVFATLLLERYDLVAPVLFQDFRRDGGARYEGGPNFSVGREHFREHNGAARFA